MKFKLTRAYAGEIKKDKLDKLNKVKKMKESGCGSYYYEIEIDTMKDLSNLINIVGEILIDGKSIIIYDDGAE